VCKPLNSGVTGSITGGALLGQNKIKVELQNAVDSNNATQGGGPGGGMKQYEVIRALGSGASGVVHLVKRTSDQTHWVAKQVTLQMDKKGGVAMNERISRVARMEREAVLQEVRVMQHIVGSPYVVRFEASFADEASVFIIMEFAERGSLSDHIRGMLKARRRFEEGDAWRCLVQTACGLAHVHGRGFIHRDIKPQNILVDAAGNFKIADFGVALQTGASLGRVRTGKGGTLQCMAPEMCEDKPYGVKIDVWSLGCTLFEMCALKPAFPANAGRVEADLKQVMSLTRHSPGALHPVTAPWHLCSACMPCLVLSHLVSSGCLAQSLVLSTPLP